MSYLPLPYIQLESARTNGADFFDTQWNAGYGFGAQFAGCAFADGGYLFGAMTSEDSADKFALQFQDGKYIYYFGDQTAESPATYELGEPHYFSLSNSGTWYIDGVSMPSVSFSLSPSNEMTLPVYIGAVNVGGEAQNLSDVQIGYINFNGSSGLKEWRQCKTQDGKFGFLYNGVEKTFVEKPDFTYGGVMAVQSGALSLVGTPTKKDYKLGEPFDITGATVYLNLDDGTQRDVTDEVSPNSSSYAYFQNNKILQHGYISYLYYHYNPVGVEYSSFQFGGGKEYNVSLPQTLYYTVSSDSPVESIEVTKPPDKTEYLIGEYFSTSGMVVTGHLENGETVEIGDSTSYSGVNSPLPKTGTFDVTVEWYDGSKHLYADPFQITVKNAVYKLNVTPPTKSEYSIGEKFNPTGITVTALYIDGTERPIYNFFVDSSKFDSTKEGSCAITVKATVDEKEYTQTITVYVFGEPKKLEDLLGTTNGMTVIRNNVKNDSGKDTISGVDWFVFDGNTASKIYVSGNNFISFDNKTEHIKICRRDGATYYVYSQAGKLDNGHKFLKIRVEGYTNYNSTASEYALKYELFLFDDNSMYLNILQAPTNTSYLGTSELYYYLTTPASAGMTHVPFTVEAGKEQVFSFYTSDTALGKPWEVDNNYHKFLADVVKGITVTPKKREYSLGDVFDPTAFLVEIVYYGGNKEPISDFTATCDTFNGSKEGRYPVTVTAQAGGQEFTAETLVAVYGEPYNLHALLNTTNGMTLMPEGESSFSLEEYGDVSWFNFDENPVEEIGVRNDSEIYFNKKESINIYKQTTGGYRNHLYIQEGVLDNGHKFFKIRKYRYQSYYQALYEFFMFDNNSMYINVISAPTGDTSFTNNFVWSDGEIEMPVAINQSQVFSFYTDDPSEGKPWTLDANEHVFLTGISFQDLLDTTEGMTALIEGVETSQYDFDGVPWFNFDGKQNDYLAINNGTGVDFARNKGSGTLDTNLYICHGDSRSGFNYLYRQEGMLDNGFKFLKIRVEGYTNHYYKSASALKYEVFLFGDGGIFLNVLQVPSNVTYLGANGLRWTDGKIPVTLKPGVPQIMSFYTDDPSQGKPWEISFYDYDFRKESVRCLTAVPTKRQYNIWDGLDENAFDVTATWIDGRTEKITDFSVDSTNFDNQKEGRYIIGITAKIGGKEYTAETLVVVYGEPHNIYNLIGTTDGMVFEQLYFSGITHGHIYGVPWFVFDGKQMDSIEMDYSNNFYFTDSDTVNFSEWSLATSSVNRVFGVQEGILDNGHRFLKIRARQNIPTVQALYELFFFDDDSIFINLINTADNERTSEYYLQWSDGRITIPVEYQKPLVASFYTTDASLGKPWTMQSAYHEFFGQVESISALATKREYSIGESFDSKKFSVKANLADGTSFDVSNYTVDSSAFNSQKEGRYIVTVKATILGTEYTANAVVVVYGEPYDILNLLNTTSGMERMFSPSYISSLGDASWFMYDGKQVLDIGTSSLSKVYFNGTIALRVCKERAGTSNYTYMQEGKLSNGQKFLKLRCDGGSSETFPTFELFLFDDNSMYVNIIRVTDQSKTTSLEWNDGKIEIPVTFGEQQKASFYTDDPSQGKPWTMELDYHDFIKARMRTLTVNGGTGSGQYLPGDKVTVKAEEDPNSHFRWLKEGRLFKPEIAIRSSASKVYFKSLFFQKGSFIILARATTDEFSAKSGWSHIGTLNDKGTDDNGEYNYFLHLYSTKYTGDEEELYGSVIIEMDNVKSAEIQESTRQESVSMASGNSFLCHKDTEGVFAWFVNSYYFSDNRRWVADPDIVTHIPDPNEAGRQTQVAFIDRNAPAQDFHVSASPALASPASMVGVLVNPEFTGYEYEMTFSMPDEDLTVEAEYTPAVDRIEITQEPFKVSYAVGESFDRSGMVVTAFSADGTSEQVTDYDIAFDSSTVGEKEVTISYTDGVNTLTATLKVYVGVAGIAITKYPDKTAYRQGETFDPAGLEVAIVFSDNSRVQTEDYITFGFESSMVVGIRTVTVALNILKSKQGSYTTQFSVFVTATGDNPFSGYNEERTLRIHFLDEKYRDIRGGEIEGESMSLTESLGNDKNLRFGGCISTQFSVNIFSEQFLDPDIYPEGGVEAYLEVGEQSMRIFTGVIDNADRTGGLNKRKLIAYDCLKEKGTIKLKGWYKSLTFPMTQKTFRDSLFAYVGIEQLEMRLKYDDAYVPDNMNADSLTFLSLIKDICLNNMVFGHVNAYGQFEYIKLRENAHFEQWAGKQTLMYDTPEDVIADSDVISSTFKEGKIWRPQWFWITPNPTVPYTDFEEPSGDEAYRENAYFVRNSYMIGDRDWISKAYDIVIDVQETGVYSLPELKYPIVLGPKLDSGNYGPLQYAAREYTLTTPGNFMRRIGTNIEFHSIKYLEDGTPVTWKINSYIMSRTITGVRSLKDVYTAKNSAYNEEAYGAAKEIRDNTESITVIKETMPKSREEDEEGNITVEGFEGVDMKTDKDWQKLYDEEMKRLDRKYRDKLAEDQKKKLADQAASKKTSERKNALTVYKDGTARYNGTTLSSGGGGKLNVQSVESLPENPDTDTVYFIQGEVVVE